MNDEKLPCGEIRKKFDSNGVLIEARYFYKDKPRGWKLTFDSKTGEGKFLSSDESGGDFWSNGAASFYTVWTDDTPEPTPMTLEAWIESCFVQMRKTAYSFLAQDAYVDLNAKEGGAARKKYEKFFEFLDHYPEDYKDAKLEGARFYYAVSKSAADGASNDPEVAKHLAPALFDQWCYRDDRSDRVKAGKILKKLLGKDRYRSILVATCQGLLRAVHVKYSDQRQKHWTELQLQLEHITDLAGPLGLEVMKEAAVLEKELSLDIARFAQELLSKTGETEEATALGEKLIKVEEEAISDLNNLADLYVRQGEHQKAEDVLARVKERLAKRHYADTKDGENVRLQWWADEFFYESHQATLCWIKGRYGKALPHAKRAHELENKMIDATSFEDPFGGGLRIPSECAFSTGSWALISALTGLKRIDEAEKIFEGYLDPKRFAARHEKSADLAEHVFLAGTCIYTENNTPEMIERSRRLIRKMIAILPKPTKAVIASQYACFHSLYGESKEALEMIQLALELGYNKSTARDEPFFVSLRSMPEFKKLVGE